MKRKPLLVRHPGGSISTLGSALMLLSSLSLLVVTLFGALPAIGLPILLVEFVLAVVLLSISTLALFRPISPLVKSLYTLTVLLNIPLVLFLVIFWSVRRRAGVWPGEDVANPSLLLLVLSVFITVIGGVISYLIAEIKDIRQMKKNRPLQE